MNTDIGKVLARAGRIAAAMIMIAVPSAAVAGPEIATGLPDHTPRPVAVDGAVADPGVATDGARYYAYTTGGLVRTLSARTPQGPWVRHDDALTRPPGWASGQGAVWAPDAVRTSAGWVLYFAMIAKDFGGQRCIGVGTSETPLGPYQPSDAPLICPVLGGEDPASDRPVDGSGVIDPSPFLDDDGTRYLLYKTQKSPGTIRMVELTDDGLHTVGAGSRELLRRADSIENPTMVKRGDQYVLFASANWFDQCRYSTVWHRSTDLWSFADTSENVLLDQAGTGLCGPGGADVINTGEDPNRLTLHGWVCDADNTPCDYEGVVTDPDRRRVMYAAVLTWGADGATPQVPHFLPPI